MLAERDGFALRDRTVGIVGVGNVGGRLQKRRKRWGSKLCSATHRAPIAATKVTSAPSRRWSEADVITFHTPLYKEGQYKTLHLADEALISRLKRNDFDQRLPRAGGR